MMRFVAIESLFSIRSGDFHATDKELDPGSVPLLSCGDIFHGLVGFYDIPKDKQYHDAITVAYNGQPLAAKYRPYIFGAKDDIGILEPRDHISPQALVYIATVLNATRWRYSYGRKCFKNKLESVEVEVPVRASKQGTWDLDLRHIDSLLENVRLDMRPSITPVASKCHVPKSEWVKKRLDQLFNLVHGDFHSLKGLANGKIATVSRTEADNGVVGYFERPDGSTLYSPGVITVSTVSGEAFVQVEPFIATDNVVVCIPKEPMRRTSTYFIAAMINHQKWRYGYGRQLYIGKLSALQIQVPWREGCMDETMMEALVHRQPYWNYLSEKSRMEA